MGLKNSAVYDINYHLVWCPRYRKPILEEAEVKEFLEDQMAPSLRLRSMKFLPLRARAHFVGTAGHVSAETIQRYIEEQKKF